MPQYPFFCVFVLGKVHSEFGKCKNKDCVIKVFGGLPNPFFGHIDPENKAKNPCEVGTSCREAFS